MKKIVCVLLVVIMLLSLPLSVYAEETALNNEIMSVSQSVSSIESELVANGTNVIAELNEMKLRLVRLLKETSNLVEKEQIINQISSVEDMIEEYQSYQNGTLLIPYGNFHLLYSPAVSAVIAYFNSKDYYLSAELLTHAKENEVLDSFYNPVYKTLISQTTEYKRLYESGSRSGSSSFEKTGKTVDDDFYYAIHCFTYYRDTNHHMFLIYDRYDYAVADYSSIQGVAVNTMYKAQEAGVIVPFKIEMGVYI